MIFGWFDDRHPFVAAHVQIPELGIERAVDFLVDTGATFTCIHPQDGLIMGLPYGELGDAICVESGGGPVTRFRIPTVLSFRDDDEVSVYRYEVTVLVAESNAVSGDLPSVLGQDILAHWRMVHDRNRDTVTFDVYRADHTDLEEH